MLELRGIKAGYGEHMVLRDVWLTVELGTVVAVLGPNGAGKTTLLRVASGLLKPSTGAVLPRGLVWDPACGAGILLLRPLREWVARNADMTPELAMAAATSVVGGCDTDSAAVWLGNALPPIGSHGMPPTRGRGSEMRPSAFGPRTVRNPGHPSVQSPTR